MLQMLHPQVNVEMYQNFHLYNVKKVPFFRIFFDQKMDRKTKNLKIFFRRKIIDKSKAYSGHP